MGAQCMDTVNNSAQLPEKKIDNDNNTLYF
jgi:hypothetical protein